MDVNEFKVTCGYCGLHPIIIEHDSSSDSPVQMMTRRFHKTNYLDQAIREMLEDSLNLTNVIRRKVELILKADSPLPEHYKYVEIHLKFNILPEDKEWFSYVVTSYHGHTSNNSLKDDTEVFATFRHDVLIANFMYFWERQFPKRGEFISKIREVVLYDDNPELAGGWSPCMDCLLKKV